MECSSFKAGHLCLRQAHVAVLLLLDQGTSPYATQDRLRVLASRFRAYLDRLGNLLQ